MSNSIHQFSIEGLTGGTVNFADFKGKKLMVVNVASECGLTPQYQQLQDLYAAHGDKIAIVGCPANNFGAQEPGTNDQIHAFCTTHFGVNFPLTTKISVKGDDMHTLYHFITEKAQNGVVDSEVKWNFQKYIFDEAGVLSKVISPMTVPTDDEVLSALDITL